MTFAGVANHARLTLVCWVVVFYMGLDNYPMMMVSTGMWLYEGQVEAGYDLHTGGLTQHSLVPMVCASDNALSLHPLRLHFSYLVDLCSEIGGLSQGAIVDAWVVAVAVHHCLLKAGFYEQACAAPGGFPMGSASGCLVSAVILSQDLEMVEDLKRLGSSDDS